MTGLAIFDFDGTLIAGDSLYPFVQMVAGRDRARAALIRAVEGAFRRHATGRPLGPDIRTTAKLLLLRTTLGGQPLSRAAQAAERLAGWIRWYPPMRDALIGHKRKGDRVLVATGALTLYMPQLLRGLDVDDIMGTDLAQQDGVLTGDIEGGNCVRAEKARRVRAYIERHGPFEQTWGYGNAPSDLPFLALMDHRTVVQTRRRWEGFNLPRSLTTYDAT
jgi:HAD superfamily hydrolase (TIGR01490 family)